HGVADLVQVVHLGPRLGIAPGDLDTRIVERPPRSIAARERARGRLAHMPHTQCIDEALERDLAPRPDRVEQVADRQFAKTFLLLEPDLRVARLERKNVGRLLYPAALEEQHDLFLAQPLDVERAPGNEMLQMLDFLE